MTGIVITNENYICLTHKGIIDKLKTSGLFEVVGPEKKAIEKWKIETELKRASKGERLIVAKKMKKDGVAIDIIKKYTGLPVSAIGKL